MYQYTEADAQHIATLAEQQQEQERIHRILEEREKAESAYEQRKQLLKSFIRMQKDQVPVNHDVITAASLALFANHLQKRFPVISGFNMDVPESFLQPLPLAIVFFDQHKTVYTTVEMGRTHTPFGAEVYDYLSKCDLNGIKAYANRTLDIETLNKWVPGE